MDEPPVDGRFIPRTADSWEQLTAHHREAAEKLVEDLARRAGQGDEEAWRSLRPYIEFLVHKRIWHLSGEDLKDLVSITTARMWSVATAGTRTGSFAGLVLVTATNASIDEIRRQAREQAYRSGAEIPIDVPDRAAADQLGRVEDISVIKSLGLSARDLRLFLEKSQGKTHEQIAKALDIPAGTVRSRFNRAQGDARRRRFERERGGEDQ